MRNLLVTLYIVSCCVGALYAGPAAGQRGPSSGVIPTVIHPVNLGPAQGTSQGIGLQTPLGYEISSGHNEDLKIANTPASVTLGGTPNGTGGVYAPSSGTSFDATVQNGWIPYDASIAV